jgi:hypothetical protein
MLVVWRLAHCAVFAMPGCCDSRTKSRCPHDINRDGQEVDVSRAQCLLITLAMFVRCTVVHPYMPWCSRIPTTFCHRAQEHCCQGIRQFNSSNLSKRDRINVTETRKESLICAIQARRGRSEPSDAHDDGERRRAKHKHARFICVSESFHAEWQELRRRCKR